MNKKNNSITFPCLEFSAHSTETLLSLTIITNRILQTNLADLPPPKIFKPKYNLPVLQDYRSPAPANFWDTFPSNMIQPAKSSVNPDLLMFLLIETNFPNLALAKTICSDLRNGAKIGCTGSYRNPTFATNAPSAYDNGPQVSDAIADWLKKGFAYGPIPLDQVPAMAKFSGIMTKPKPNGSVRIILNLSAPLGSSVNEGINPAEFPTTMSSTTAWLRVLRTAGKYAKMCKIDWADAYKHVAVCREDTELQWFSWAGMAFKELCLIFGCASSAGLFDRLAKVVLHIVLAKSNFPKMLTVQHLDDCCAAAPANSTDLELFDFTFNKVAQAIGVKLAPRDDPDKSFAPSTSGLVLGIRYDTVSWTWSLGQEKLIRLLHDLQSLISSDSTPLVRIWSIVGKLIHIKPLIPCGKFNFHHLLKASAMSTNKHEVIILNSKCKQQLFFWYSMLRICPGNTPIPDPDIKLPPWAIDVYCDAAGGSLDKSGLGVGAVTYNWWAYLPWSRAINSGRATSSNRKLSRAMSALELIGPLLILSSGHSWCKNKSIKIWVDNSASVFIWQKGYSTTCALSTTLVIAINKIATGLGCQVDICKITRCSNVFATLADHLSKANFGQFRSLAGQNNISLPLELAYIPSTLLRWVQNPTEDDLLGDKILHELSAKQLILGFNC